MNNKRYKELKEMILNSKGFKWGYGGEIQIDFTEKEYKKMCMQLREWIKTGFCSGYTNKSVACSLMYYILKPNHPNYVTRVFEDYFKVGYMTVFNSKALKYFKEKRMKVIELTEDEKYVYLDERSVYDLLVKER